MEILKLKNTLSLSDILKKSLNGINSILRKQEKNMREPEGRSIELTQMEIQREKNTGKKRKESQRHVGQYQVTSYKCKLISRKRRKNRERKNSLTNNGPTF